MTSAQVLLLLLWFLVVVLTLVAFQLQALVKAVHALARELREPVSGVSESLQELQGSRPPVTRDVTAKHSFRTVPLNTEAKVTAYPENGEPFLVPQDGSSSPPVK